MPTYKCVHVFNQFKNGWQEQFYLEATDITTCLARVRAIALDRSKLCGSGTIIESNIVSDVDILGDSDTEPYSLDAGPVADDTDTPWNSLYVRAQSGGTYRRQFHLRGVPDDWIVLGAGKTKFTLPAECKKLFNVWAAEAKKGPSPMQMRVISKAGIGGVGVVVVGSPTSGAGGWTVVNAPGSTVLPGEQVGMKKWKGPDKKILNRVNTAIAVDGANVTISIPFSSLTAPTMNYAGRVYPKKYTFVNITKFTIVRTAAKKTGRAFFVSPGRRSNKQA